MQFKSDSDTLNCQLSFNGKTSRPTTQLAYSQALKDTKELTVSFGYDGVTEKSFRFTAAGRAWKPQCTTTTPQSREGRKFQRPSDKPILNL